MKTDKRILHRFVWMEEGPVLDELQRMEGRGAYCCRGEKCLHRFLSQKQKWRKTFRK
ncbi:DUF448 domain-containing protein [Desulfopila inferna]|nr:DUF448 domain-containing protein [Desulfopila inferna]